MNNELIIGQRIDEILKLRNLKQKDLAEHLKVKDNTISYFCSGKRTPNTTQIIEIAKYLNVTTDYLLGLSPNSTIDVELQAVCKYTGLSEKSIQNVVAVTRKFEKKNNKTLNMLLEHYYIDDFIEELSDSVELANISFDNFIELLCACGYGGLSFENENEKANFVDVYVKDKIALSQYKSNRILNKIQDDMVKTMEKTIEYMIDEIPCGKRITDIEKEISEQNAREYFERIISHIEEEDSDNAQHNPKNE